MMYTLTVSQKVHILFFNSSVKNRPILIIFEEIWHKCL